MTNKNITFVFILASVDAPHILKRIGEFIENGYNVKVYGFKHFRETSLNTPKDFKINIVGEINQANYIKRIWTLIKGIRKIQLLCKGENVVYYLPSLDIAIFHLLFCRTPYIYEESDLKHTYVKSQFCQYILEIISKYIIKKSQISAFTSEGFIIYHFDEKRPANICLVPNKLRNSILNMPRPSEKAFDTKHLRFSFVGKSQFQSVYHFAHIVVSQFPQHEVHFFGTVDDRDADIISKLSKFPNCFFHGRFSNPVDLPKIYSCTDILLSIFDLSPKNWLYAEPNKLYDAIYFRTPMIVPRGTFLEKRVKELGIGFCVDVFNDDIPAFVNSLTESNIREKIDCIKKIPQEYAINNNKELFEMVNSMVEKL